MDEILSVMSIPSIEAFPLNRNVLHEGMATTISERDAGERQRKETSGNGIRGK